jgi:hypothetical protein
MKRYAILVALSLIGPPSQAQMSWAQAMPPTEVDAQTIAVNAYVYFYPLVTMDVTRKQFTNIEAGKELGKGPMNVSGLLTARL